MALATAKPISRMTGLAHRVADEISEMLVEGNMQPGDQLPSMADMETQLGVSHSVMREALRILESRGQVQIQHGKKVIVSANSAEALSVALASVLRLHASTLSHLMEYRRILEPAVAELAAERRTEQDMALMEAALKAAEGTPTTREVYVDADLAFHNALLNASHNPVLRNISDSIMYLMATSREITFRGPVEGVQRALRAHRRICEVVVSGDAEGAREATLRHLVETQEDLDLAIKEGRLDYRL
jgi:GntR family transcriptional repressor for pyruvate dehydrogenase complex